MAIGGSAGGATQSIFLQLNGRQLFEGATLLRRWDIQEDAPSAWAALETVGQCYLRLYGDNLPQVRALYADWLSQQLQEAE